MKSHKTTPVTVAPLPREPLVGELLAIIVRLERRIGELEAERYPELSVIH
jgi:hypothetical protein